MTDINSKTPMEKLTPGGDIYTAGNSVEFKTGDWRSSYPVFLSEKCKQCGLCVLKMLFQLEKIKREKILIMIIVKDVVFVPKFVLSEQSK